VVFAIQDLLALKNATGLKDADGKDAAAVAVNQSTTIIVTYDAQLTKDAVVIKSANENTVTLNYYNNPNDSGEGSKNPPDKPGDSDDPKEPTPTYPTGETEKSTTKTYTTSLSITKENDSGQVLTGAAFTLTGTNFSGLNVTTKTEFKADANGSYWKLTSGLYTATDPSKVTDTSKYVSTTADDGTVSYQKYSKNTTVEYTSATKTAATTAGASDTYSVTASVDENGLVTFTGLGEGHYTLTETTTPAGYNTMDPISFDITFDADNTTFKTSRTDLPVSSDGTISTIILNHAGGTLPHTGGIGTTIFYVVGSIMLLGAGILFITKKRMGRESD
jgi:LPXTG-motif cell wall-anchored protein